RMKLHGQAAIRLFDLVRRRTFRYVEELVIILLRHLTPYSHTPDYSRTPDKDKPPAPYEHRRFIHTICHGHRHRGDRRNRRTQPPSGLLAIAFLDLFELRVEHVVLRGFGLAGPPAIGRLPTRRLLVHFLQDGGGRLLQSLGLALELLAIITAH